MKIAGITIRKIADTGEYRVNYIGASERYAYYTNDRQDAIDTAQHMAANRPAVLRPDLRINR